MSTDLKILVGIGLGTLLIVIGAVFLLSKNTPQTNTVVSDKSLLVRDYSPQTASSSAKVTVVEFGDFQCPACGAAHPVVSQILKTYTKDQLNLVFRNFPLPIHRNAQISSLAAMAAGDQGKFWEMLDKLYQDQTQWSELTSPLDKFVSYATEIGLDINKFKSDIETKKYDSQIQQDISDGYAIGVNATPTFYVNGLKVEGVPSFNELKSKIDSQL